MLSGFYPEVVQRCKEKTGINFRIACCAGKIFISSNKPGSYEKKSPFFFPFFASYSYRAILQHCLPKPVASA